MTCRTRQEAALEIAERRQIRGSATLGDVAQQDDVDIVATPVPVDVCQELRDPARSDILGWPPTADRRPPTAEIPMSTHLRARLQILAAAILFSTGGVGIKSCQLSDWQVASFRCGVAAVVLGWLLPAARRRWSWRTFAVGGVFATTLILFVLANKATTAANTVLLQGTAPLYLVLLAPLLLGERSRGRDLMAMAALGLGLVLLLAGDVAASATAPAPARGNLLAAAAGLSWAATLLGFRWLEGGGRSAAAAVVAGSLIGFLVPLPWALPVVGSRPADWLWVLFLGAFQVALGYRFLTSGVRSVPAFEAALLLLVEPVMNPVWAFWVHREVPGPLSLVGGALILLATVVKTWLDVRKR